MPLPTKVSLDYLNGKKIVGVRINPTKDILIFDVKEQGYHCWFDARSLIAVAVGDCCSSTWFEDIFSPKQLIGGVVTKTENIDVPQPDQEDEYEFLEDYGIRITTDLGVCDIIYRNSSNGYYSGYCEYELAWDQSQCKPIPMES